MANSRQPNIADEKNNNDAESDNSSDFLLDSESENGDHPHEEHEPLVVEDDSTQQLEALTAALKRDKQNTLNEEKNDIDAALQTIAQQLSQGIPVTREQQDFLTALFHNKKENNEEKKDNEQKVIAFKANEYAKYYKWTNRKIFGEQSLSLGLEAAYFFWSLRTSGDGVRDAGRVFFHTDVSDATANGIGGSTSALDFLSNVSTFDPATETKKLIVQYAESEPFRKKVNAYLKELCSKKAPGVAVKSLWHTLNWAVCKYHNLIGGYATILGVTNLVGTGPAGVVPRLLVLYLTNVYYDLFLTPKFNTGLKRHVKNEFITTKALKGMAGIVSKKYEGASVTTPLNVAYTVACASGLRAVSFAYMLPEIAADLSATVLPSNSKFSDFILSAVENKILCYSVIGYHTLGSRFFGTYDKYFKDADELRALLHGDDSPYKKAVIEEILRLAHPGLTLDAKAHDDANFEFKKPGLEKRLLEDASQELYDQLTFKEKFADRMMTLFNLTMRLGEFGFLGYAIGSALLPEISIMLAIGTALLLGGVPVLKAEWNRMDAARLLKHINDTILNPPQDNEQKSANTQSKAALFALAVLICGGSALARFLGNVTFLNDEIVDEIKVQKQLSLAMSVFVALETVFNGFDITIVNNVPTIAIWGERIKNAFARCCNSKKPQGVLIEEEADEEKGSLLSSRQPYAQLDDEEEPVEKTCFTRLRERISGCLWKSAPAPIAINDADHRNERGKENRM